ncbi:MAG: dihydroxyacetone kinase phosphoryl donor subunit DhaM [Chloroflexota bacterium]|jgi:dihydroxyacetone kinase phosphotransfer subunit
MIGIVIVSHHPKIAEGVRDLAQQMTQGKVTIAAAGGVDDTTIGTNVERIYQAILAASSGDGVLVLLDLGSAVMSAQAAVEMLPEGDRSRVRLSNAPLVEGAIVAAVQASIGSDLSAVNEEAEKACTYDKLS